MDGIRSASIIPFPARTTEGQPAPRPQPAAPLPVTGEDATQRLRAALAALEQAVAGQREAVARWRGALGELGGSMQGLHTSLSTYDSRLGALRGQLDGVAANARALEAWADSALASVRNDPPK
jgi:hypothetical protein